MSKRYPKGYDDEFLNIIKDLIDRVFVQGQSLQELVAEGQLTSEQYSQLLITLNGLSNKNDIVSLEARLQKVIDGLGGAEEFYTPIGLDEYMTTHGQEWVI